MHEDTERGFSGRLSRPFLAALLSISLVACGTERAFVDPGVARHTLQELRYEKVVRQDTDYSCGAASLATLMTYYFGDPTTEEEILALLTRDLDPRERELRELGGYSLFDLKQAAVAKGYRAAGYRLTFDQLRQLAAPVLVYVVPLGYRHFAVLRDVVGDRVLLADPARGNLRMSVHRFLDEWGGIAFVLGKEGEEEIGSHSLAVSAPRDVLPDRLRIYRQLDIADRLYRIPHPISLR